MTSFRQQYLITIHLFNLELISVIHQVDPLAQHTHLPMYHTSMRERSATGGPPIKTNKRGTRGAVRGAVVPGGEGEGGRLWHSLAAPGGIRPSRRYPRPSYRMYRLHIANEDTDLYVFTINISLFHDPNGAVAKHFLAKSRRFAFDNGTTFTNSNLVIVILSSSTEKSLRRSSRFPPVLLPQ